jgi:uncharacterized membrane protein YebE (DUF533 family)
MSFGNMVAKMLQDGLGQGSPTRGRVDASARHLGEGSDNILAALQNAFGGDGAAAARSGSAGGLGGLADRAGDFLRSEQVGGLSGAQVSGIGAAAGALLGGGLGGAARGTAMAVLGTLALRALRGSAASAQAGQPDGPAIDVDPDEASVLSSEDNERLVAKAMINAAKADGKIDKAEIERILGKLDSGSVTEEERAFVVDEMRAPINITGLAADARTPAQAAQVYAATLLAIHVDTEEERQYLRDLAIALKLDAGTVRRLHEMTEAPAA